MWNASLDESQTGIKIVGRKSTLDMLVIPLYGRKQKGTKELLRKVKEESEKADLKLNIQTLRSWHLVP